jgi:superfamily II DNA helicase RecQ
VNRDATAKPLKRQVRCFKGELQAGEGILIVVRSKYEAEVLHCTLKVPFYHSDLPIGKKDMLSVDWATGRFMTIVSTSALGTSVHHPACRVIIHFELAHRMINFARETGHLGRNSDPGMSLLM